MTKKLTHLIIVVSVFLNLSVSAQQSTAILATQSIEPDTLFTRGADELVKEPNVEKKEIIYQDLLKNYPPDGNDYRKKRFLYIKMSLALFWSSAGNKDKALSYYHQVKNELSPGMAVAYASNLLRYKYYKDALAILDDWMDKITEAASEKSQLYTYLQATNIYANALYSIGKKQQALMMIKQGYEKSDKNNIDVNTTLATILNSLEMHADAIPIMEILVKDGMATDEIKRTFKDSYIKNNGTQTEFDKLMISLNLQLQKKMKAEAGKKLIDEPSYAFSLMDIKGKIVSLSDLKGKVVVLDFWATWCGPCIRSMPAMNKLVAQYKSDENVVFLFIDTGEKITDFESAVKKLLDDNNYDFRVLYDVKSPLTNKYPTSAGYKLTGIPTKLIIDPNGRIRYRIVGYNGGIDATVTEMTAMIENTKIL